MRRYFSYWRVLISSFLPPGGDIVDDQGGPTRHHGIWNMFYGRWFGYLWVMVVLNYHFSPKILLLFCN